MQGDRPRAAAKPHREGFPDVCQAEEALPNAVAFSGHCTGPADFAIRLRLLCGDDAAQPDRQGVLASGNPKRLGDVAASGSLVHHTAAGSGGDYHTEQLLHRVLFAKDASGNAVAQAAYALHRLARLDEGSPRIPQAAGALESARVYSSVLPDCNESGVRLRGIGVPI